MKLLVLLAVLGAVSAQYQVYSGVTPYYNGYTPYNYAAHPAPYAAHLAPYAAHPAPYAAHLAPYAAHPAPYAAHPAAYAAHPFPFAARPYLHGLPLSFKPAEENKAAEVAKPAVESRSKRSADEDQTAEDATFVSTYATHPYPLTYTAGYPYTAYSAPTVYNSAYNPVAYHGCNFGVHGCNIYNGYTAPVVHSLKKRDTAAAEEDLKADDTTFVSTYAAHPLTYNTGYPYTAYNAAYQAPAVYSAGSPAVAYSGYPYSGYPNTYRTFY